MVAFIVHFSVLSLLDNYNAVLIQRLCPAGSPKANASLAAIVGSTQVAAQAEQPEQALQCRAFGLGLLRLYDVAVSFGRQKQTILAAPE
jgi:hypothetical protein